MIGSYLAGGIRTNRESLDVSNLESVLRVCKQEKPEAIIHLAAFNDLAAAERDPAPAYLVNAVGTYHMALAAREVGAKLLYVSTSGVFDGTKEGPYLPSDTPNPVNVYGHTKYLGELAVQGTLTDFLIVRTSWVFGGGQEKDKKFVGKLLREKPSSVRAVGNRHGSPTYAKDFAEALWALLEKGECGIVHVGGGIATRFEVAQEVAKFLPGMQVEEARAEDFPAAYQSGPNESMEESPLMRPWREGLADYVYLEWK